MARLRRFASFALLALKDLKNTYSAGRHKQLRAVYNTAWQPSTISCTPYQMHVDKILESHHMTISARNLADRARLRVIHGRQHVERRKAVEKVANELSSLKKKRVMICFAWRGIACFAWPLTNPCICRRISSL